MKINEEELANKVIKRLDNNNLVREFTSCKGRNYQTVRHKVYDDGLEIRCYAVIAILLDGVLIGHLDNEYKSSVYKKIREVKEEKQQEAFLAL